MKARSLWFAGRMVATAMIFLPAVETRAEPPLVQGQTVGEGSGASPLNKSGTLTGKERLGRKWSDEQRLDNCNVPIDKRGTRPRPSECVHAPSI